MRTTGVTIMLGLGLLLFTICAVRAAEDDTPAARQDPAPIQILPGDGMNLVIEEALTPHHLIVKLRPPAAHNWFSLQLTNLPTDQPVTIGFSMEGNNTAGNIADVKKWIGLSPVMTYGDPKRYEINEWFAKDAEGRWVSGDPLERGDARFAGDGPTPEQTVIPAEVAAEFLSKDGTYWQPWREIDEVEVLANINIFRIRHHFARPTATIAMRVPFTYTYLQQLIARLQAAQLPGVFVDEIGTTVQGNKLQVIRIEDPDVSTPLRIFGYEKSLHPNKIPIVWVDYTADKRVPDDQKVFLITAREHATEHASSHIVHGLLRMLIGENEVSQALRQHTTWLLIPIQDPDGSIVSSFDTMVDQFWQHSTNPVDNNPCPTEVLAYANYLRAFVNSGRPIAASVSWHNVECNEGENVFAPFITVSDEENTVLLNQQWFTALQDDGYLTGKASGNDRGYMRLRLYGWCGDVYRSMPIAYEVNDRLPGQTLPLNRLENIGESFSRALWQFYTAEAGKRHLTDLRLFLQQRQQAIAQYYASEHPIGTRDAPSIEEIMSYGF